MTNNAPKLQWGDQSARPRLQVDSAGKLPPRHQYLLLLSIKPSFLLHVAFFIANHTLQRAQNHHQSFQHWSCDSFIATKSVEARKRPQQRSEDKPNLSKMPQLFPANPSATMVIRHVTPEIVTMSLPFARFGHLQFGGRGTLGKGLRTAHSASASLPTQTI